jgi:hypothetical protein
MLQTDDQQFYFVSDRPTRQCFVSVLFRRPRIMKQNLGLLFRPKYSELALHVALTVVFSPRTSTAMANAAARRLAETFRILLLCPGSFNSSRDRWQSIPY